jgi:serine/threonine protein kinase
LKAFGKLNERLVASYVVKILEGLHYLHSSDVVHCDLKAANILTTKNGNVKLSDFGVSLNLRAMEREIKDVAGTPNWMAPEVIELKGASPKSDIWSLACTVVELLTGRPPYAEIANSMSGMHFPFFGHVLGANAIFQSCSALSRTICLLCLRVVHPCWRIS